MLIITVIHFIQRWARAYRDKQYHAAVDTNNGVEAQNKLLKYKFMPRRRSITLSNMVLLIVEEFLPEMHSKYLFQNYAMSADYRSYNDFVPNYLRGRPRKTILHCLDRKQKVQAFSENDITIVDATNGVFEVKSQSGKGKVHTVDFLHPSCSCKDWIRHHIPCKHFFVIFHYNQSWQWDSLPTSYLQSEYLSQDCVALAFVDTSSNCPEDIVAEEPAIVDTRPTSDDLHTATQDEIPRRKVSINNKQC